MSHTHYYTDLDTANKYKLLRRPKLLYTGMLNDVKDWFSESQSHAFCEMLYIYKGHGKIFTDGVQYNVKPGDLVIYNPEVVHKEHTDTNDPFQFVFLAFENLEIYSYIKGHLLKDNTVPVISTGEYRYKLESIFFDLLNENKSHINGYEIISESLLISIIILVLRIQTFTVNQNNMDKANECQRIKSFIDGNYTKPLTLNALSEIIYISRHHLAHIFKNEFGVPPIKYLIIKRMNEAKQLLSNTDIDISEIAQKIGYENPTYFSQLFKKTVGLSPLHYRNSIQTKSIEN